MANSAASTRAKAIAALGNWGNLRRLVEEAVASGELEFDLEVHSKYYAPGVFAADLCHPGEVNLWPGSMFGVDGLDPDELTRAEIVTRDHAHAAGGLPQAQACPGSRSPGSSTPPPRSACARLAASSAAARRRSREALAGDCARRHRQALRQAAHAHPLRSLVPPSSRRAAGRRALHVGAAGRDGPAAPDPRLPGHRPGCGHGRRAGGARAAARRRRST